MKDQQIKCVNFAWFVLTMSLSLAVDAGTLTYSGGNWDTTSASWENGTEKWVDGNSAVFPAGKGGWVLVSGTRTAENVYINGTGYYINWGGLAVTGKFYVNEGCQFKGFVAGDSIRFGGTDSKTLTFNPDQTRLQYNAQTKTYLEDRILFNPSRDLCFGPVPSEPSENIVVSSGNPFLYGNATLDPNRSVKIEPGASLRLGSAHETHTLTVKGTVSGEVDSDLGFATNSALSATFMWDWKSSVALDPGAGRTNDVGRLSVYSFLKIASGTTRVGSAGANGTGSAMPLYVAGNNASYSPTRGNLVVDGGTVYASQISRYSGTYNYGQVTVTNGGSVYMPNVHWLNMNGRLTVADGGSFTVETLRISHSQNAQINLEEGGLVSANRIGFDPASSPACQFRFNGGRVQSRNSDVPFLRSVTATSATEEDWSKIVFSVGEKGAVLDTSNGSLIWWTRPLVSGAENDGGLKVTGRSQVVMLAANTYNGPTVIESGVFSSRKDNAVPAGSTVRLGGGTSYARWDMSTYQSETPARNTVNTIGRLEGDGEIMNGSNLTVTDSVAPDADGMLHFYSRCALSGIYEISGDGSGCGCMKVASNQNISGLTLDAGNMSEMDRKAPLGTYKILDAPGGYSGRFSLSADFPSEEWAVRYTSVAVYLCARVGMVVTLR